jgi:hypothetical protein
MATTTGSGASKRPTTRKTTGNGTARTRLERRIRKTRRLVERELRLMRRDLGKQSDTVSNRVERILSEAHGRLSSVA